jgi:hypothetical protein
VPDFKVPPTSSVAGSDLDSGLLIMRTESFTSVNSI